MTVLIREISTLDELKDMARLEAKVWGQNPIPLHQTLTATKNGGVTLAAYRAAREGSRHGESGGDRDDHGGDASAIGKSPANDNSPATGEMIGFLYSFPGYANGEVYLCSHMLAVDPDCRDHGIGARLKQRQAEVAKAKGYRKIRWTYDPLESRNAYLNIAKLGAVCSDYIENCYGDMDDELNRGMPSDRFNVEWLIDSPHLEERHRRFTNIEAKVALRTGSAGTAVSTAASGVEPFSIADFLLLPIPSNFQTLKKTDPALALDWRLKTREALQAAFADGWAVAHFLPGRESDLAHYVLVKRDTLLLE